MQTKDVQGNVLSSKQLKNLEEVKAALMSEGVASVSVGKIPRKGDRVEVCGLQYEVMFVDATHGILKLRLLKLRT